VGVCAGWLHSAPFRIGWSAFSCEMAQCGMAAYLRSFSATRRDSRGTNKAVEAQIRQLKPDSGLGFQAKALKPFKLSPLRSEVAPGGTRGARCRDNCFESLDSQFVWDGFLPGMKRAARCRDNCFDFAILNSNNFECSRNRTVPVVNVIRICAVKCPEFGNCPFEGNTLPRITGICGAVRDG